MAHELLLNQPSPIPKIMTTPTSLAAVVAHPLEPLTKDEILAAVRIVRSERQLHEKVRFASINLHEPSKEIVLGFQPGTPFNREAFVILLDNTNGFVFEAVVSIKAENISSWRHVSGVQPSIMLDEFFDCEQMLKKHPAFKEALRRRGITDMDLVMVDPWSSGYYSSDDDGNPRLSHARVWVRAFPGDNGYAHPVEGVIPVVDLNKMELVRIEDNGIIPIPSEAGNYITELTGPLRTDLKPLEITQPEGPSFTVTGHEVRWQKWRFRVGFTTREGLVLHTLGYEDKGKLRSIIYRASLSEMVVPYGDPSVNHFRKNAFDVGEYGIGSLANSLKLGCDCLGYIHYFDANMTNSRGELLEIPNAICMHEEDYGILWKHVDWRTNHTDVRRSRRLVISFIATVGNYEYGFFWYLYQDGTIQFEIKLTGIMNTGALPPNESSKYGTYLAPGLYAPIHQHIFNVRLDMMVDGLKNSVYEVNSHSEEPGPDNPYRNAYYATSTLLASELAAQRTINPQSARYWKVVNHESLNFMGEPVAYKIMPGDNAYSLSHPDSAVVKRASFTQKHLWVTPFNTSERYPTGDYPNQNKGGSGLPHWTQADRSLKDEDVVLWYTMNAHHIPRLEDWPVMPVSYIGFMLKPVGFFDKNPGWDVPPALPKNGHCCS
jgi:primary-amine oxidase